MRSGDQHSRRADRKRRPSGLSAGNAGEGGTGLCKALKDGGREWSLAWFSTADEKRQLLEIAAVFLTVGKSAWIAPLWDHGAKEWTQPEAPNAVKPRGLAPPVNTGDPRALKALGGVCLATTVESDPSSGDAYVLCRENK